MVDDRVRHHAHLVSGAPRTPAQVEIVAVERQLGIESAEGVPDIAAYEHPGGADGVHLTALIVLTLVVLPAFETGHPPTRTGDAEAHLEE
jgi:hypothetical protein